MKKVAFVLYRRWAYDIYRCIAEYQRGNPSFEIVLLISTPQAEFDSNTEVFKIPTHTVEGSDHERIAELLSLNGVDVVFYYGWSWFVKETVFSKHTCVCLHPSPLPLYRGGSPLQNQIIAGEKMSAVTVFKIDEGIDSGDIYKALPMSLEGSLEDIFSRMVHLGTDITKSLIIDLIRGQLTFTPQVNFEKHPPHARRTKKQSEIEVHELQDFTYEHFFNLVRALADPYPNVCVIFPESKLFIQKIEKLDILPKNESVFNGQIDPLVSEEERRLILRLKDTHVLLTRYSFS